LQSVAEFPFVSMVDEVVSVVKNNNIKQVGLLGTPSTIRSAIYQDTFSKEGIKTLVPSKSDFPSIEKAIRNVISESTTKEDRQVLRKIADHLKETEQKS